MLEYFGPKAGDAMLGVVVWMADTTASFAFLPFLGMDASRVIGQYQDVLQWSKQKKILGSEALVTINCIYVIK